jgi:hypothetical protein
MSWTALLYSGLLILQIITMNMAFSQYAADIYNKFEEQRLEIAVNYATDAAAEEMRYQSSHLGQDYESIGKINVDPKVAMETFATMLCKNYNVPDSASNRQQIMLDYCPVFVVATYDGYYILNKYKINDSGVENMIFSTKFPYSEKLGDDIISYNLSFNYATKLDKDGNLFKTVVDVNKSKEIINNKLSDVLNEQLTNNANKDPKGTFFIPSELSNMKSSNPVNNTTVFAYMDNFDLSGYGLDLQSFSIGGSDIKQKKVVVGFRSNLIHGIDLYYTYSDRLPSGVTPLEVFDNPEDAAKKGYYFYVN